MRGLEIGVPWRWVGRGATQPPTHPANRPRRARSRPDRMLARWLARWLAAPRGPLPAPVAQGSPRSGRANERARRLRAPGRLCPPAIGRAAGSGRRGRAPSWRLVGPGLLPGNGAASFPWQRRRVPLTGWPRRMRGARRQGRRTPATAPRPRRSRPAGREPQPSPAPAAGRSDPRPHPHARPHPGLGAPHLPLQAVLRPACLQRKVNSSLPTPTSPHPAVLRELAPPKYGGDGRKGFFFGGGSRIFPFSLPRSLQVPVHGFHVRGAESCSPPQRKYMGETGGWLFWGSRILSSLSPFHAPPHESACTHGFHVHVQGSSLYLTNMWGCWGGRGDAVLEGETEAQKRELGEQGMQAAKLGAPPQTLPAPPTGLLSLVRTSSQCQTLLERPY